MKNKNYHPDIENESNDFGMIGIADAMAEAFQYLLTPRPNFNAMLLNASNVFERMEVFRRYYRFYEKEIIACAKVGQWVDPYQIDFMKWLTPIEYNAWCVIRCYTMVFYPQYPVGKFMIDFANPWKRIGIELDGKNYHDPVKDKIRDTSLANAGWKIFRITGKESFTEPKERVYGEQYDVQDFLCNTMEGVIESIRHVYFNEYSRDYESEEDANYYFYCLESLNKHKLADFTI